MKTSGIRLAALLMFLVPFALAQNGLAQLTSLPVGAAAVADFKGDVSLHSPPGDSLVIQKDLVLDPESRIETRKGSILLNLQDGSQALVKSNSDVVLKSPELGIGLYLELLIGKLVVKVQKRLGEAPPFRMGTPSAVITVRGTRFEVEVTKKNRTYVEVFEGAVEVQGRIVGGRPVLIRPGFSTSVERDHDPQPPRNRIEELRELEQRMGARPGREIERPGQETERPEQEGTREPREREREDRPD
jgi:hypothetical protein